MEDELRSCDAIHVNNLDSAEAFHAAACDLLEAGLSPDDNYYRDHQGKETFSLWYYRREFCAEEVCQQTQQDLAEFE